jgi:catechol 2,3-dioxygenase-like lactoylglutathione lyase family enzyme
MPVSHIGLTVSHLPTSCSFFLAALQPLGYRFLGQWGNQIGLGVNEADFFLTQETPGIKAGAAHVAFSASSRTVVREFYANALQAGGRPHGSPASRTDGDECFNAAVLDLDGNSVEVVFHEGGAAANDAASAAGKSRLLTWRDGVSANLSDKRSTVDSIASAATSLAKKAMVPANSTAARSVKPPSEAPSAVPTSASKTTSKPRAEAPTIQRSFTMPALTPQSSNDNISISRKTLVGTILGAAAGAAVAYAMCKSEEDSAKAEQAAYLAAQGATKHLQASHPHLLDAKPAYSSPARSIQNASEIEYVQGHQPVRAIEAPPPNYQHPSFTTVVSGQPAPESVAAKSRASAARSHSYPESQARSSIISSFVPEEQPREILDFDAVEYRSSHSHAKSSHSKVKSSTSISKHSSTSKRSSHSRDRARSRSKSRTPQPGLGSIMESEGEMPAKASSRTSRGSKRTSVLGRSVVPDQYPSSSEKEISNDDLDTIVPSDSVSQVGSSSRRSHRRHAETASHHSTPPRRDDGRRTSEFDMMAVEPKKKHKKKGSHRTSEAGTESTMTPGKFAAAAGGNGSVMSLPVRGITPSMIGSGVHGRSIVSYYG